MNTTVYYLQPDGDIKEMKGRIHPTHPNCVEVDGFPYHLWHEGKTWWKDRKTAYQTAMAAAEAKLEQMKKDSMLQMELIYRLGCCLLDEEELVT